MIRTPVCRTCIALGFLVSALVHGLATALMLRMEPTPMPLPEMKEVELELAMFGPPGPSGDGASPQAGPAPPPPSESPPGPEPDPVAKPPEPESKPEPTPSPRAAPEPPPKPKVLPPTKEKPQSKSKPKPEKKPAPKPKQKPKPIATPEPRQGRLEAEVRTESAPSRPRSETSAKAGPTTVPGARAPGGPVVGSAGSRSPADRASAERAYLAELQRAIARQQRFPEDARRRRVTGVATLAFVVQADGRIGQVRVVKSSGDSALDQAAVQALNRLGRFKPIPTAIGRSSWPMRVPIRFDFR